MPPFSGVCDIRRHYLAASVTSDATI
ncbi:hypothetical protein CCACVL1_21521 [Corchorus capsularis]|uniref:Uncharacterized protein n=1 Tax=Corchorus capsularis TaxID=210143 RepID=A0A1R3H561_COCAP|nr:hypothetical protein CCACVL1_21521 [Corchorus capsularis]